MQKWFFAISAFFCLTVLTFRDSVKNALLWQDMPTSLSKMCKMMCKGMSVIK